MLFILSRLPDHVLRSVSIRVPQDDKIPSFSDMKLTLILVNNAPKYEKISLFELRIKNKSVRIDLIYSSDYYSLPYNTIVQLYLCNTCNTDFTHVRKHTFLWNCTNSRSNKYIFHYWSSQHNKRIELYTYILSNLCHYLIKYNNKIYIVRSNKITPLRCVSTYIKAF